MYVSEHYNRESGDMKIDSGEGNGVRVDTTYKGQYNNYLVCGHTYANHVNYSRTAPAAYTLPISTATPDRWTTLSSAIDDLKTLRDEIQKISETKVKAKSGSTRPVINFDTTRVENADAKFAPGQPAQAAQINETITNIENLYNAIKGTGSGLTSINIGTPRRKQQYKDIISKAQILASENQPQSTGYANHVNCNDSTLANHPAV
jgi:hypothetical protein